MKRQRYIWFAFAGCLLLVLAAMVWISRTALRLERDELAASRQAAVQEKVRLALWRMDSALGSMIARESARPYFTYTAFYPVDRAYTRMFAEITPHEILVPSPLLIYESPDILLHFQFDPSGNLTSPQAPEGNQRDLAETGYVSHERITAAAERLAVLKSVLKRDALLAILPVDEVVSPALVATRPAEKPGRRDLANLPAQQLNQQAKMNTAEWRARSAAARDATVLDVRRISRLQQYPGVCEGPFYPVWVGEALVLARRVRVNGGDYVQGCRLNWRYLRRRLLAGAEDLLPEAGLAPASGGAGENGLYMLAALPVKLLPGEVHGEITADVWSVGLSLLIAWCCIAAGAVAVALVLRGAVRLSRRRGAFVSAVTHELRTPLTTFRLYADMLAGGMITDEKQRGEYLDRLRAESERLSHLVENVLSYARLSGPRSRRDFETVSLGDILDRSRERLATRAEQADMTLLAGTGDAAAGIRVRVNVSVIEQILLNLVDNACKYAARSDNRTIEIGHERQGRFGLIRVRDYGPGIAASEAKRLFRPFHKSAGEAARSAPGVGLGLALSRRLARDMKGDLRIDESVTDGACFVLSLPVRSNQTENWEKVRE